MQNLKKNMVALACMLALAAGTTIVSTSSVQAATITSSKQGLQQWSVLNGKLMLVAGTYQDTTSYKRSLTFFFEEKAGGAWLHVPVIESEADHTLTWFSVSAGETTVADAIVTTQGDGIYLIIAEKKGDKSSITATWYKFSAAGADFPDGPAYLFKSIASNAYPKTRLTVEDVLKKETGLKAKK
jgi:hypothetical protein